MPLSPAAVSEVSQGGGTLHPDALLEVRNLCVDFGTFAALKDVSFDLHAGETLGLVGESGSGKSTLARAILRLIPATRGAVMWRGLDLLSCDAATLRRQRRDLQIVFQDPLASLNPRMTVGETLAEPLRIFEPALSPRMRQARILKMLERVGLAGGMATRYPHEFSGGQCQRIGIARAMMAQPKLLICDEPVSSLDVSIQGQIVNLLLDLQEEFGTAMLFISHNLAVVRHLCHRVFVIYLGRLVEIAARDELFAMPVHPYTRALLAAVPDPTRARADLLPPAKLAGNEVRLGTEAPSGCAFRNRCAYAAPGCALAVPQLEQVTAAHAVACHRWGELVYS
jgi:oligopeptide transport system ATP-binding protein